MRREAGIDLTNAVMATADAFLRESQRLFRPFGLTAAQYNVLNVLAPQAAGMSQRELSDYLVVDRSNVTGLLDRMEKAGWVQRADDPADRRIYRVTLTPSGRNLWRKVEPRYRAVVDQVTRGVTAKRLAECIVLLDQLAASASKWQLPEPSS
jgi:DNA-binding MarR family transcriptional regulator